MKLTRKKSATRRQAVLDFFVAHPDATGDEAQAALMSGKLTGERGPALSIGVLYELRKRALEQVASFAAPTARLAGATPPSEALAQLRQSVALVQKTLGQLPDVAEVIIGRDGARLVRMEPRQEAL